MKKKAVSALILAVLLSFCMSISGCEPVKIEDLPAIQKLRDIGTIRIAVAPGLPGFCWQNPETGQLEGYEVDIARYISKAVFGDEKAAELVPMDAKLCGPKLETGEVDIVIAAFYDTQARREKFEFSQPYFTDYMTLLVKRGPLTLFGQMSGKKIGFIAGNGTDELIKAEAGKYTDMAVETVPYGSYPEAKQALLEGKIDALCSRWAVLRAYADIDTVFISDRFAPQNYAIACIKGDMDMLNLMNAVLDEMKRNGLIDELINKWDLIDTGKKE
ncbi:MAG: transporter substrate-binding domain-containing protein [Bacillota bacterium]|nr:transporter substrate-binding domain-containing protein [Bacillota bacterium]